MREIKFRAKDFAGNWVYGDLHLLSKTPHIHTDPFTKKNIKGETIGQYTGLKDENEKEIYEGDIVEWVFFYTDGGLHGAKEKDILLKGVIRWEAAGFIFEVRENDFENAGWYGISSLNFDPNSDIKVIGNIYDNKEYLEE